MAISEEVEYGLRFMVENKHRLITGLMIVIMVLGLALILLGCSESESRAHRSQHSESKGSNVPIQSRAKQYASRNQNMQGYKNARWGISNSQVSAILSTTLTRHYGVGVFGTKSTNQAFYALWRIPKSELWGRIQYSKSMIPMESFQHFENPDGDRCLFYEGKFCCYYFDVSAKNYNVYYNEIASKYGSPSASSSFPGYDTDGSKRYDISVKQWNVGETMVFLIKSVFSAYEIGMVYTEVTFAYFSTDIFREIANTIQGKINAEQISREQRRKDSMRQDLGKIQ